MPEYEVLHAIRRKASEEPQHEGTVSMSEKEAQVFLDRGAIRPVPSRGRRKQANPESESEDSNEE